MNQEKHQGIIIKLIDYLDADKLASIFTLQKGIVLAKFAGVKKDKAKLKAVAQPFTFADFVFNVKADKRTVTSAEIIDSFPTLITDYNKTICGYIILDMIKTLIPSNKAEEDIFLLTLSTLKNLEQSDEYLVTIDYILKFISFQGMAVIMPKIDYVYLDEYGNFASERSLNSIQISKPVYNLIKNPFNCLDASAQTKKQALRLLKNIIYLKFGEEIKSFAFLN